MTNESTYGMLVSIIDGVGAAGHPLAEAALPAQVGAASHECRPSIRARQIRLRLSLTRAAAINNVCQIVENDLKYPLPDNVFRRSVIMRDSRPDPIDSLFGDATETGLSLSKIQQRAIMLLKLNRAVNALLPVPLRPWCCVANVRQRVMVLETANASWKMRLFYEQPQLLSALRSDILPSLSSIDIRINPYLARKQELNAQNKEVGWQHHRSLGEKPRYLSVQSGASIRHVAARCEGKLKNALERLAELAGESPDPARHGNRRLTDTPPLPVSAETTLVRCSPMTLMP